MKMIRKISDEQFERLNWHEQKYYRFCQNCGMYRDIRDNEVCNCEKKLNLLLCTESLVIKMKAFKGFIIALPFSIVLWLLIFLLIKSCL